MADPPPAPSFLDLPAHLLPAIAQQLPVEDRLRLGEACTQLHNASTAWFPEITVGIEVTDVAKASRVATWLRRHPQTRLHLLLADSRPQPEEGSGEEEEEEEEEEEKEVEEQEDSEDSEAAEEPGQGPEQEQEGAALTAQVLQPFTAAPGCLASLDRHEWADAELYLQPAALAPFSRLQRLGSADRGFGLVGDLSPLWLLTQLTSLQCAGCDAGEGGWGGLRGLTRLQSMDLIGFDSPGVLGALPALSGLTALSLWGLQVGEQGGPANPWRHLGGLPHLEELGLNPSSSSDWSTQQMASQVACLLGTLRSATLCFRRGDLLLPAVAQCTKLTSLTLRCTQGNGGLPAASLARLALLAPSLQKLDVSAQIVPAQDAPASVSALTGLTYLSLQGCQGIERWDSLAPLSRLHMLHLTGCDLDEVPPLPHLPALTDLGLMFNPMHGFAHLPAVGPQLRRLALGGCWMEALPPQLTCCTRLCELDVGASAVEEGWEHLPALAHSLKSLDLSDLERQALPAELSALTGLTHLDLRRNPIKSGWEHLLPLTRLSELEPRSAREALAACRAQ